MNCVCILSLFSPALGYGVCNIQDNGDHVIPSIWQVYGRAVATGWMKVGFRWIKGQIELYRESATWQGLAVTSRSSISLPFVGSDSWVLSMLDMAVWLYTAGYCSILVIPNTATKLPVAPSWRQQKHSHETNLPKAPEKVVQNYQLNDTMSSCKHAGNCPTKRLLWMGTIWESIVLLFLF